MKEMILKTWNIINGKNTTEMVNKKKKLLFSQGSLNMLHGFKEKNTTLFNDVFNICRCNI